VAGQRTGWYVSCVVPPKAKKRKPVKPEVRARALELLREGWTQPEIARRLRIGERSIRRWAAASAPQAPAPAPVQVEHRPALDDAPETPRLAFAGADAEPPPADARGMATAALGQAQAVVERAHDAADRVAQARGLRASLEARAALEAIEHAEHAREPGVWQTPADIDRAVASVMGKVAASVRAFNADDPRCTRCKRALGIELDAPAPASLTRTDPREPATEILPVARLHQQAREIADDGLTTGNYRQASRGAGEMAKAARLAARAELAEQQPADGAVFIAQAELNTGERRACDNLAVLAGVPLLCLACLRETRILIASNGAASS
jgi:hypothetical protein